MKQAFAKERGLRIATLAAASIADRLAEPGSIALSAGPPVE